MKTKDFVDITKSIMEIFKNLVITITIIGVFAFPTIINRTLVSIGVIEFDLWGLKGKTSLVEVDQALNEQRTANGVLVERLTVTDQLVRNLKSERYALQHLSTETGSSQTSPVTDADVDALTRINATVLDATSSVRTNSQRVLEANSSSIAAAQESVAPVGSVWGVVFGGDTTIGDAQHELSKAREAGIRNVRIYRRQNWFRSVAEFSTRESAADTITSIQSLSKTAQSAYVVNLATWCPHSIAVSQDLTECTP